MKVIVSPAVTMRPEIPRDSPAVIGSKMRVGLLKPLRSHADVGTGVGVGVGAVATVTEWVWLLE